MGTSAIEGAGACKLDRCANDLADAGTQAGAGALAGAGADAGAGCRCWVQVLGALLVYCPVLRDLRLAPYASLSIGR